MDDYATDDQRALLEVSMRFMPDVCPLRAVRDGAWKDAHIDDYAQYHLGLTASAWSTALAVSRCRS